MSMRQTIYASTIIMLAEILFAPCALILGGTIITAVLGAIYFLALLFFLSSTRIGRWFFVELYRSTLRIERLMQP